MDLSTIMDKNKSAFKLRNFGPIYYLNLDGQPERREYMENQFKYWEIENYTRISAYDGREDDLPVDGCKEIKIKRKKNNET